MPRYTHRTGCRTHEHPNLGRRSLIQAGGMALLGTGLEDLLRIESQAAERGSSPAPRAKSVIFIFQSGGASQLETWDPKPLAPAEVRGEYGTTATKLPGFHICEYLPQLAARTHLYSVVRSMANPAERRFRNEHGASSYMLHTGKCELPVGETTSSIQIQRPRRFEWPSIGSMLAYALPPSAQSGLPAVIDVPRKPRTSRAAGKGPGVLGPKYARWEVDLAPPCNAKDSGGSCPHCFSHDQPDAPERAPGKGPKAWYDNSSCRDPSFQLPDLQIPAGLSVSRLNDRAALLGRLNVLRGDLESSHPVRGYRAYQHQALQLIAGQKGSNNPFDLDQEPEKIRQQYGHEEWGQALLVARRLVESGVRMVQVNLRGWDTHQNAFRDLKGKLLPSLDRCLSGFLDDMHARGLLEETLVVMCGEMGRTPRVMKISNSGKNAAGDPFTPGRDHWGDVFSCFFAGGGVQPGRVIGESDKQAGSPVSKGFSPSDLAATIFHQMGVGPEQFFYDHQHRPHRVYQGEPIRPLL